MKRISAIALFTIGSFIPVCSALAQNYGLEANVPFAFSVGNKLLPAGTYRVSSASSGVVRIENNDDRVAAFTTTSPDPRQSGSGSKLVFDKYDHQYFLHQILCPSSTALNVRIPASSQEKRIRLEQARLNGNEHTLVAAK